MAGDVNGDGFADVIVGADLHDGGQQDEGRAYVYHGSRDGLSPAPDWIAEGEATLFAVVGEAYGLATDLPAGSDPQRLLEGVRAEIRDNRDRYDQLMVLYSDCGTGGGMQKLLDEGYDEVILWIEELIK